jgi:hypothetical protein
MVYAVQNSQAYFGLYPSSGIYKTKNLNVSETDPVSETWFLLYMYQTMDRVQNKPNNSVQYLNSRKFIFVLLHLVSELHLKHRHPCLQRIIIPIPPNVLFCQ